MFEHCAAAQPYIIDGYLFGVAFKSVKYCKACPYKDLYTVKAKNSDQKLCIAHRFLDRDDESDKVQQKKRKVIK